jgi:hypothetical protein
MQWPKEIGQKDTQQSTKHYTESCVEIEQHETYYKPGLNSGASECVA